MNRFSAVSNGIQLPRLDRLVSIYLCHPLARLNRRSMASRVPILKFHSISENLFGKVHPYSQINTTPAVFSKQMRWLRNSGYTTIELSEAFSALESGTDMSKKVVITFDSGYMDFYTDAFPVLKQCGFTATVFLATDRIQNSAVKNEGVDYLTWQKVRELQAGGIAFGSHTVTHPDLHSMTQENIDYELCYSKEVIEEKTGVAVTAFSYPFPFPEEDRDFTRFLSDALMNAGYSNGVCSIIGRAAKKNNQFFLPRLPVNSWDDETFLRTKVEGGYDWVHFPQWAYKFVHHNVSPMQRPSWFKYEAAK